MAGSDRPGYPDVPTLEKIAKVSEVSQAIGQFLDTMSQQGIILCKWQPMKKETTGREEDGTLINTYLEEGFYPDNLSVNRRLAEYFGIDIDAADREKEAILEYVRHASESPPPSEPVDLAKQADTDKQEQVPPELVVSIESGVELLRQGLEGIAERIAEITDGMEEKREAKSAEIRAWIDNAGNASTSPTPPRYLVVVCDTFSYEDYPVYVWEDRGELLPDVIRGFNGPNMQIVMAVYDLQGDIEAQIREGGHGSELITDAMHVRGNEGETKEKTSEA